MDFAGSTDDKVKMKENIDNHLDLASDLKNLWNIKMTVVPIVVGALGTVVRSLKRNWKDWKSLEESGQYTLQYC